jgi:hypothetical protein
MLKIAEIYITQDIYTIVAIDHEQEYLTRRIEGL